MIKRYVLSFIFVCAVGSASLLFNKVEETPAVELGDVKERTWDYDILEYEGHDYLIIERNPFPSHVGYAGIAHSGSCSNEECKPCP